MYETEEVLPRFQPKPTGMSEYQLAPMPSVPEVSLMIGGSGSGIGVNNAANVVTSVGVNRPPMNLYSAAPVPLPQHLQPSQPGLTYANWRLARPTTTLPPAAVSGAYAPGVPSNLYYNNLQQPQQPMLPQPLTSPQIYKRNGTACVNASAAGFGIGIQQPQTYITNAKQYQQPMTATSAMGFGGLAASLPPTAANYSQLSNAALKREKMKSTCTQTDGNTEDLHNTLMNMFEMLANKQEQQKVSMRLEIIEMQLQYMQNAFTVLNDSINRVEQMVLQISNHNGSSSKDKMTDASNTSSEGVENNENGMPVPMAPFPPLLASKNVRSYSSVARNRSNLIDEMQRLVTYDDDTQKLAATAKEPIEPTAHSDTDKSIFMNELAKKYLPNDKLNALLQGMQMKNPVTMETAIPSTHIPKAATPKGPSDLSSATYMYLKKYQLLPVDKEEIARGDYEKFDGESKKATGGSAIQHHKSSPYNSPNLQHKKLIHNVITEEAEEEVPAEKNDILKLNLDNIKNQPKLL